MNFDTYFCFCFSLILRIFHRAATIFWQFSFSRYSLLWYLGARNNKLSIIESYSLWVDIRYINGFQYCFLIQECLSQLLKVNFKQNFLNIITGWKICHCIKQGLKVLRIYICQNSVLKMTNGIRKVRLGVDIFILETVLHNTVLSTTIFSWV